MSKNCNSCDDWRLVVWEDGSSEYGQEYGPYTTKAGKYYGGHSPCELGDNYPLCGVWENIIGKNMK